MEAASGGLASAQHRGRSLPSGVSVRETADGKTLVRINGRLPIGWLGSLSSGISQAGFGITRGRARQAEGQRWDVELELTAAGPVRRSLAVDYLLLASRRRDTGGHAPISVESYSIGRDPERGALVLGLRGADRVGFLGSLLDRLAALQMFPVEMEIETVGETAVDRFFLQSFEGKEPSEEAGRRLAMLLDSLR